MNHAVRNLTIGGIIALSVLGAAQVRGAHDGQGNGHRTAYAVTSLVSDLTGAAVQDKVLQNAWGVAFSPAASPFWVSDNATGCSTLYGGDGAKVALQVSIPLPGNVIPSSACSSSSPTPAAPTGMVWNPSSSFLVPGTKSAASFIFATEDGTLSAWTGGLTPPNNAVIAVDNSQVPNAADGAVYKGLVVGVNVKGVFLFAANFRAGKIDVFGPNSPGGGAFPSATTDGNFTDPQIPAGFAPFGIQNIDGDLYVTYAMQDAHKHDDVAGPGNGFVDVFDTNGNLLQHFASGRELNSPWGIARASAAFGEFSGDILVGNFGDGKINAFDYDGRFMGQLEDANGKAVAIDGLWTLTLGGGRTSSSDTLYFTAGPNGEKDGLFGTITPTAFSKGHGQGN